MFATPALALLLISPEADASGWPAFLPPPALARLADQPPRLADRSVEEIVDTVLPFEPYHTGDLTPEESRRFAEALGAKLKAKMRAEALAKFGPFDGLKAYRGLEQATVGLGEGELDAANPDPEKRRAAFSAFDRPNFRIQQWYLTVAEYRADRSGNARLVLHVTPQILERNSYRTVVFAVLEEVWHKKAGGGRGLDRSHDITKSVIRYDLH